MDELNRIRIDRVVIENYRSIKRCDVELPDLTFLVGRNGSGKSSFFDAFKFLSSALEKGWKAAVEERNGLTTLLFRPVAFPCEMGFAVYFSTSNGMTGYFSLRIRANSWTEFASISEKCRVGSKDHFTGAEYSVDDGILSGSIQNLPPIPPDRLYLSTVAGFSEFRTPYELLKSLVFSGYSSKEIHLRLLNRFPQAYDFPGYVKTLTEGDPDRRRLVEEYLRLMIPNLLRIGLQASGDRDWVAFVEKVGDAENTFYVSQISDGTVYALEFLMDLFVKGLTGERSVPVLIEEPGMCLHPWAAGVVRSAIMEASRRRQVLITTHSPDLLDDPAVDPSTLRVVYRNGEGTHVETLSEGALAVLRDGLTTPGELFRRGALGSDDEPEVVSFLT